MSILHPIIDNLIGAYASEALPAKVILAVQTAVLILSVYEFAVYRLISRRTFYNRSFNISITVLPFFIAIIILCLQSNLVITLGTIGALAIIRFRTAIKDPVDMIYLLWSITIGIVCGCRLIEAGVLTSLMVTVVLIILNHVNFSTHPQVLVIHTKNVTAEKVLLEPIKEYCKHYRIKSRNFGSKGVDYVFELSVKDITGLTEKLTGISEVERFSLIEYDSQDIL